MEDNAFDLLMDDWDDLKDIIEEYIAENNEEN
jgi:hypothetical protein